MRSKLRSRKAHHVRAIVPGEPGQPEPVMNYGTKTEPRYMRGKEEVKLRRVCGAKRGLRSKYGQPVREKKRSTLGAFWSKVTGAK